MSYNWYIIAILAGVALIWIVYGLSNYFQRKEHNKSEELPKDTQPIERQKKNLDYIFAKENNSWVCKRCETINSNGASCCAACGYQEIEEPMKSK